MTLPRTPVFTILILPELATASHGLDTNETNKKVLN